MSDIENPIWKTIEYDEKNVAISRQVLVDFCLLDLLERIPELFRALPREVEAALDDNGDGPFTRKTADGQDEPALDFILRLLMLQSAEIEFLHSVGHLLRGHSQQLYGHARTMIENAGVAYLSKRQPDLGHEFLQGNRTFRRRTTSEKILPKGDSLTKSLNEAFAIASTKFHANLVSMAGRLKTEFSAADKGGTFRSTLAFHDVEKERSDTFLRNAAWLTKTAASVLRVFGSAFGLPDCIWYERLALFEDDMTGIFTRLRPYLEPKRRQKSNLGPSPK